MKMQIKTRYHFTSIRLAKKIVSLVRQPVDWYNYSENSLAIVTDETCIESATQGNHF